jgi:hypothetical protein
MDSARHLRPAVVVMLLLACVPAWGDQDSQKIALAGQHTPGELSVVEVAIEVGGDLKLVSEGLQKQLPMSVVANLKYEEQIVALDQAGHPRRARRWYHDTRAVIKVDQGGEKPSLDPERRLIVVEDLAKAPPLMYCPDAPCAAKSSI